MLKEQILAQLGMHNNLISFFNNLSAEAKNNIFTRALKKNQDATTPSHSDHWINPVVWIFRNVINERFLKERENILFLIFILKFIFFLYFSLETSEWDIDDDTNIVFTPHCPDHHELVDNDDDTQW